MKVLVTGGGGFLGGATVRALLASGHEARSFGRSAAPELEALGVEHVRGDLARLDDVERATRGVDAVIHTAAKAGVWGRGEDYFATNVVGTRNVIEACRRGGVERLVHTSTPSVVHKGGHVDFAGPELPYAGQPGCAYQGTKITAERLALEADGEKLGVVALRPHLLFGPGDPHLVPRILQRASRGRMALPDGGRHPIDVTFIENAADAHVAALERLSLGAPCAGRAYFITNAEPRPLVDVVKAILAAGGVKARVVPIPARLARAAGALLEDLGHLVGREAEPPLTRFVAAQLSTAHTFDPEPARRDLGYTPRVGLDEAFEILARSLSPASN